MRKVVVFVVAASLMALGAFPSLAQIRDIVGTADRDPNFSTFVSLVEAAGLTESLRGEGPLTVFAPTNGAFDNLLSATGLTVDELVADTELLTTILTFHVLGPQPFTDINQNGVGKDELRAAYAGEADGVLGLATLSGEEVTLQFTADDVIIMNNQAVNVTVENLVASNGVIHAINGVLLPPSLRNEAGVPTFGARSTVVDLIAEDPDSFSTLLGALDETGLTETLQDVEQQFTVFAPTNGAFLAAQGDLAEADLAAILGLHVLPGRFTLQAISNEIATRNVEILVLETITGETITLQIDTEGTLLLNGQGITVTDTDNLAANGVVHFSPGVILPTAGFTMAGLVERDSSFSVLGAALEAAGLAETLADPEADLTVFAPTDDAFNNLLAATGLTAEELLADTELLTTILSFHVLPGAQSAQAIADTYALSGERAIEVETVGGELMSVQVDEDGVILLTGNGTTVSVTDIAVDNGVVHAVPAVLLPPSLLDDNGLPLFGVRTTVVDYLSESPDFSLLASLLEQQGLMEALATGGPYTVFAPTNGALQAQQATLSTLDAETLSRVLQFHVVEGSITRQEIDNRVALDDDGILQLETLSGDVLTLQVQLDGTVVMNGQGITPFLFDQITTNGVIHGLPGVLLPQDMQ
jgi:transforming growth factor-beta-induced protein